MHSGIHSGIRQRETTLGATGIKWNVERGRRRKRGEGEKGRGGEREKGRGGERKERELGK